MAQTCRVCNTSNVRHLFKARVLTYEVDYYECEICKYVQTEEPFWLEEAYQRAINVTDVGIMKRNLGSMKLVLASLICLGRRNGKVIDMAGGYGLLVRLLRDFGIDARWADAYCENIFAVGHERQNNETCELVTCFEAFEHFEKPATEMEKLLKHSGNVLVSTELIARVPPREWYYYGRDHGQHIGFFRLETLQYLARKYNKKLITDGRSCHLFSEKKINRKLWLMLIQIGRIHPRFLAALLTDKIDDESAAFNKS